METRAPWNELTIPDVESLLPNIHWTSYHRRSRKIFFSKVATLDAATLQELEHNAIELLRVKADKREEQRQIRLVQREEVRLKREDDVREARRRKMTTVPINENFLEDVGMDVRKGLLKKFIDGTSNAKTQQGVCSSCGGIYEECDLGKIPLDNIADPTVLKPCEAHPSHKLVEGMLLEPKGIVYGENETVSGFFCSSCFDHIKAKTTPPLSLANNMWIGEVPFEFEILTVPERLLISLYYPAVYVYKLYPKNVKGKHVNFKHQKLQGNVSTYRLSPQEMSKVVTGNLLPRKPDVLASLISITLVGWKGKPELTLSGMLRIRRKRIHDALLWAKRNNPFYANIDIDETVLQEIPEDGIPDSLLSSMVAVDDIEVAAQEADTYVPEMEDEDEIMSQDDNSDMGESADNDGNFVKGDGRICQLDEKTDKIKKEPNIIPLSENAVVDVNGFDISPEELLWHSIQNVESNRGRYEEPPYTYQRGTNYVNEYPRRDEEGNMFEGNLDNPNHLLGAFPYLFPYGVGGFEVRRRKPVSYRDHARWALRYHDGRFAKNITFIAQVFNVMQKREVCKAAEIQISRKEFKKHEHLFKRVTPRDLKLAAEQESRGEIVTNVNVRLLKRLVTATRRNISGTDEHRQSLRSRIFGMIMTKGPPTFWLTINFADMKDPLVQLFSGEDIDMDDFVKNEGLPSDNMSRNATENPFAATKAFFFLMKLFFEELLQIKINSWGHLKRQLGMFGMTESYMGSIEAQGRGTLHVHLFVWLSGCPTSGKMQELLKEEQFRHRLEHFIGENIRSHVDGLDETYIASETTKDFAKCKKIANAFSRPLDPEDVEFESKYKEFEFSSARVHHVHTCSEYTCKRRGKRCKRRAPWTLSEKTTVLENGEWVTKRKLKWLNTWNPLIMMVFRSNHDIKILTNANGTRDVVWYTTKYASKRQSKSFNMSAILATKYFFNQAQMNNGPSLREANRKMLSQCVNTVGRYQEFSSQQLVALIMGWGDRFESHPFVPIHVRHLMNTLRETFDELKHEQTTSTFVKEGENSHDDKIEPSQDMALMAETSIGLRPKNQVSDYMNRGRALEDFSFLDFWLESYEPHWNAKATNPRHERVEYDQTLEDYRGRYRILRHVKAEVMPDFLGSWPPRNNDAACHKLYCATILALLKPWRSWHDLKGLFQEWENAMNDFIQHTHNRNRFIVENIQFYYDSRDTAYSNQEALVAAPTSGEAEIHSDDEGYNDDVDEYLHGESRVELQTEVVRNTDKPNEMLFGKKAVEIGLQTGVLRYEETDSWNETTAWRRCTPEMMEHISTWNNLMKGDNGRTSEEDDTDIDEEILVDVGSGVDPRDMVLPGIHTEDVTMLMEDDIGEVVNHLTKDQRRACLIVAHHLDEVLRGSEEQLFMQIVGSGGVGKSVVIKAIEDVFKTKRQEDILAITATTGIAASHIGGQTIHHWAGLPIFQPPGDGSLPSDVQDPTGVNSGKSFGGKLNVIVVGDYHQFPPPGKNGQVMYLKDPPKENIWAQKGYRIFQDFTTVVILKQQMRATDEAWSKLLERVRTSDTTSEDVDVLNNITLTNPRCDIPDFNTTPWCNAVLVTPRHGVRNAWNQAMVAKKAYQMKKTVLTITAEEYIGRSKNEIPYNIQLLSAELEPKWKLPYKVEVFEGMRCLITHNVCVDANLANGTVGTLERVILDPREPAIPMNARYHSLKFQPAVLIFRPDETTKQNLPNLPDGTLPVEATKVTQTIQMEAGQKKVVHRLQYPLTPAYSFTDYKSQAQSISPLLVDIAKPPSGGLTTFNTYVALSRSKRREHTRILRDFDRRLFMQERNEDLRIFDEKLEELDAETIRKLK